jgi:type II secretory pathway pseudopilin PulG
VRERLRDESGFGLLELMIALIVLNVALFATITAFNSSTVAIARSAKVSAATAVADKQMEVYRSLQNCAIWLDPTSFPATSGGSTDDALYRADTNAYSYAQNGTKQTVAFFDKSQTAAVQAQLPWATSATSQAANAPWNGDIPTSCTPTAGTTPPPTATKAEQTIAGPNGALFPVFTYVIIDQPAAASGTIPGSSYIKQVTVVVRDPQSHTRVLARETTVFNPLSG